MLNTSEYVLIELLQFYADHPTEYAIEVIKEPEPGWRIPQSFERAVKQGGLVIMLVKK